MAEIDRYSYIVGPKNTPERKRRIRHAENNLNLARHTDLVDGWTAYDSPLLTKQYDINDPIFYSYQAGSAYEKTFTGTLPEESQTDFCGYCKEVLAPVKGRAVGVDLGGTGERLFDGFDLEAEGKDPFFSKTFGIVYLLPNGYASKRKNHTILQGNIFNKNLRIYLRELLKGKKINFLTMRLVLGDITIPKDPKIVLDAFEDYYEMLDDTSLMFASFPTDIFQGKMRLWLKKMQSINKEKKLVDLTLLPDRLRLVKSSRSPEKLFNIK